MPEGPEIRRAADRLAAAVVGQPLTAVHFAFPALKHHQQALVGRRIESIRPHGKALLTRFDNGLTLYSHNQLYGVWQVAGPGERPETTRSLRVALETDAAAILLYSASDVAIWRDEDLWRHPLLARLGPDVLEPSTDRTRVLAQMDDPRHRGRRLGTLLLDQGFLAGMGNYLRSEVLFEAELPPFLRPRELDDAQRERLAAALLDVPRRSYATRGIDPAQGMRGDYLTDTPEGFRMKVFGRAGEPCERCGQVIERREVAGRRLYRCPDCQR